MRSNISLSQLLATLLIVASTSITAQSSGQHIDKRDHTKRKTANSGFLFINGKYIQRPYEFRSEYGSYWINEVDLATLGLSVSTLDERQKHRQQKRARRKSKSDEARPLALVHSHILASLLSSDPVLLVSGLPPFTLEISDEGGDLLRDLAETDKSNFLPIRMPAWATGVLTLGDPVEQQILAEHLSKWIASFEPSEAFLKDARSKIGDLDTIEFENHQTHAATLRLATFGYPLTILIMILVVLGFGHLLSHHPNTATWNNDSPINPLSQPFNRSLMLIGGLSAADLIWTLLASQAGAMHELNPIGSKMIENPFQLVAFKILITLTAVGLLYFCRRLPLARQASWWSCLVLTLVAARWLVFNSMFIS